ncbi:hypothetical protein SEETMRM10607_22460 [Salmonella enterica subsp. enterica serovar Typhimurium]|nr:hypothetical protein SEETMRM10607_22460 [Salmonella enterica subsp. enterica serovar Typhimurium]
MNLEYKNPQIRLIAENTMSVKMGGIAHLSPVHPTTALSTPIKPTYSK